MVKVGDRIELIRMNDPYNSTLKPGDQGIVIDINRIEFLKDTQISVNWDNGSSLMLVLSEDKFKIIK